MLQPNSLADDALTSPAVTDDDEIGDDPLPTTDSKIVLAPPTTQWMRPFLFGQAIAFIAASMNASSYVLVSKHSVQTRLFQLFFVYLLLFLHLFCRAKPQYSKSEDCSEDDDDEAEVHQETLSRNIIRESSNEEEEDAAEPVILRDETPYPFPLVPQLRLRIPWHYYLGISLLDVTPNLLALASFQYTSLTSTTLLGSLAVPSTMFFSRLLLGRVFVCHHYFGVLLCVLGGCLTVYMDTVQDSDGVDATAATAEESSSDHRHHHSYMGDLFAILSALMYGLGDCVAEYAVKHMDRYEYLGMLGLFGLLITGLLFPWLEFHALQELFRPTSTIEQVEVASLLVCFVLSVGLYYVAEARFLVTSDATLLNLSMQSVNLWAYLFTRATERPPATFFLAVTLVVVGVFLYEVGYSCRRTQPEGSGAIPRRRTDSEVEIATDHRGRPINYQSLSPEDVLS
jgi:solute carrier family 35, member F1/2